MTKNNIAVKKELLEGIKELCNNNKDILLVSLATTDGFAIKSVALKELNAESDKLAAMSSTISSLSDSSAKQVLQDQFDITIVETKSGNLLFVRTTYLDLPCVLTIATRAGMQLATSRYKTINLAKAISKISK